ncbi:LemA family protein [Pokkaliibacter sp. CJK22405]|uniref:LemA family protein n=1 Tax=Pokkaliibacter sp. CJK22405 TaxID=3384615 RepID=UPI003984831B
MDKSMMITLVVTVLILLWGVVTYNGLITRRLRADNAFAQIEVQLKRRYDLIPSLVETAKGYMQHERDTLTDVIAARDGASQALGRLAASRSDATAAALSQQENLLGASLERFKVTLEAYPDLKANTSMQQLAEELTHTENKVERSRQFYNDAVTIYNTFRQTLPQAPLAPMLGHGKDLPFLNFDDTPNLNKAPKVSFS